MMCRGKVKNGVVVLDDPTALPEGTEVTVRAVKAASPTGKGSRERSLYDRFKPFVGIAKHLPADLAANHDHYLHGAPRR